MNLSLSVRIAEEFLAKEKSRLRLEELASLAREAGYQSLCMRASQVGVQSSTQTWARAAAIIREQGLSVSMVTGDFAIVYNNDAGPGCLRNIGPYLDLAKALEAPLIRVALKTEEDIAWAQRAADQAAKMGLKLAHQCHTESLFETIDGIRSTLQRIDRPNFGLIYEPANLELCGQDYGSNTIESLAPWIFNVYLQNHVLNPEGMVCLNTWCRGPVKFDLVPIHAGKGIDFLHICKSLASINYQGAITAHQSGLENEPTAKTATTTADYLRDIAATAGL